MSSAAEFAGGMCWPTEWFREDLPLEDRAGTSLERRVRALRSEAAAPAAFESFVRAPWEPRAAGWEDPAPAPEAPPGRESVLVFSDARGVCRAALDAAPDGRVGSRKFVGDCWQLARDDVRTLLSPERGGWDLVVFGPGLDAPRSNSVAAVLEQQDAAARLYLWVLQELQLAQRPGTRLAVLTRGVFAEDPGEHRRHGVQMLTGAPLWGMSNSARLELELPIQCIDTEWSLPDAEEGGADPCRLLPRLASELLRQQTFGQNSVRVLRGGRYVLRRVPSRPYEAAGRGLGLPGSGTVAITGGGGARGLAVGEYLLDLAAQRGAGGFELLLLSRSAKPVGAGGEERWRSVQGKAAGLGVPVRQARCDVSDPQAVEELIGGLKGRLTGLVHAAGQLRDAMLANLTWERLDAVFGPKHRAALHLHAALERHENPGLRFFWLFSSTAVFGNLGQVNLSGSCSCVDALARHRAGRGRPAAAVQWGAWGEEPGSTPAPALAEAVRRRADAGPEPPFGAPEALAGLEAGLRTGLPGFSVLRLNRAALGAAHRAADTALQCLGRNFLCEVLPLAPVPAPERRHAYTLLREAQGPCLDAPGRGRLVYEAYTLGFVEEAEGEWGDDFRRWSPLPK